MSRPDHEALKKYAEIHSSGYGDESKLCRAYLALFRRVEDIIARMNRENADRGEESVRDERKRLYTLLTDIREIATGERAALSEASQNE